MVPAWVSLLTSNEQFFQPCMRCSTASRGREVLTNYFDIDAPSSSNVCSMCRIDRLERGHKLLQIRRSSHQDVAKVMDLAKLAPELTVGVQTYVINSSKVIFLRRRPVPRPPKETLGTPQCRTCSRLLQDANVYCSLECKKDRLSLSSISTTAHSAGSANSSAPQTPSRAEDVRAGFHKSPSHDVELTSSPKRRKGIPRRAPSE